MSAPDAPQWEPSVLGESYTLTLCPGVLILEVFREIQNRDNPSPFPYAAKVFDARLKARYATADTAKAAALRVAQRFLAEATTNLDKVTGSPV